MFVSRENTLLNMCFVKTQLCLMSAQFLLAADHVNSSSALGHLFTTETVAKDTLHPPAFTSKTLRKKE